MSVYHSLLDCSDLEWIARACGKAGRLNVNQWVCLCPAHDDHKPSLSLSLGHKGQILLYCHAGCSYDRILDTMRSDIQRLIKTKQSNSYRTPIHNIYKKNEFKLPSGSSAIPLNANSAKSANDKEIPVHLDFKKALKDAKPIIHTPVEAYLNKRLNGGFHHIKDIATPDLIQYLPSHWHAESHKSWPVMVASILNGSGEVIGLHRTYLDEEGHKAPVSPSKKILGKLTGGAAPFGTVKNVLVLAEGIETALSLYVMFQTPVWAVLSSTNMTHIALPPLPLAEVVYIAQDNDRAGRMAGQKAANRFWREGRRVILMNPPDPLNDFNDYLMTGEPYEQYKHRFC